MKIPPVTVTATLFVALHFALAAFVPIVNDEAYYTDWARWPALGYYDHPGMIAWWIWLAITPLGESEIAIRSLTVVSYGIVTILTGRIAFLLSGRREIANLAAFWVNCTLLVFVLGFIATPDSPSVLFWTASVWAAIEARQKGGVWWLAVGLFAGLGVESKFTNLFFGVGLTAWLLATKDGRRVFNGPWIYLGGLVAVAAMVPVAWWNHSNDWLGLERQFGRIQAGAFSAKYLVEYLALTFLALTPVIGWQAIRAVVKPRYEVTQLLWFSAPLVLYLAVHSTHSSVSGSWLAPIFPSLAALAAMQSGEWSERAKWLGGLIGLAFSAGLLALALWPGGLLGQADNPPNQTKGWTEFAAKIDDVVKSEGTTWIATRRYGTAGALAFYLPDIPTWSIHETFRFRYRPDFPQEFCNEPALFLVRSGFNNDIRFDLAKPLGEISRTSRGATIEVFDMYLVRGPQQVTGLACE